MPLLSFIFLITFGVIETLRYSFHDIPHPEWIEVLIPYILLLLTIMGGIWR